MGNSVSIANLHINQGDDYELTLSISGIENISGGIFKLGARYKFTDDNLVLSQVATIIDSNTIQFLIPHTTTAMLNVSNVDARFNRLYYDVQMIFNNRAQRILQGNIYVSPGSAYKVKVGVNDG